MSAHFRLPIHVKRNTETQNDRNTLLKTFYDVFYEFSQADLSSSSTVNVKREYKEDISDIIKTFDVVFRNDRHGDEVNIGTALI